MNHRNQRLADELRAVELEEERTAHIVRTENVEPYTVKEQRIRLVNKWLLLDQAQDDLWLELMNPQHDSFPEYIQAVVQFTFVSCFSVVLPITPVLVLINYLISMRLDAYKVCKTRRRPLAERTGGIEVREHVQCAPYRCGNFCVDELFAYWFHKPTTHNSWSYSMVRTVLVISDCLLWLWDGNILCCEHQHVALSEIGPQYETDKQRNTPMLERRRLKSRKHVIGKPVVPF